jgi:hypothetical protein
MIFIQGIRQLSPILHGHIIAQTEHHLYAVYLFHVFPAFNFFPCAVKVDLLEV